MMNDLFMYAETRSDRVLSDVVQQSVKTFKNSDHSTRCKRTWAQRWARINKNTRETNGWNRRVGIAVLNARMKDTTKKYKTEHHRLLVHGTKFMEADILSYENPPTVTIQPSIHLLQIQHPQIISIIQNSQRTVDDLRAMECLKNDIPRHQQMLASLLTNSSRIVTKHDIYHSIFQPVLPPPFITINIVVSTKIRNMMYKRIMKSILNHVILFDSIRLTKKSMIMNFNPLPTSWVLLSPYLSFHDILIVRSLCTGSVGLVPASGTWLHIELKKDTYRKLRSSNGTVLKQLMTMFDRIDIRVYRGHVEEAEITLRDILTDGMPMRSIRLMGPGNGVCSLLSTIKTELTEQVVNVRLQLTSGHIPVKMCLEVFDTIITAFPLLKHLDIDMGKVGSDLVYHRREDIEVRKALHKSTLSQMGYTVSKNHTLRSLSIKGQHLWHFDPFMHRLYAFHGLRKLDIKANMPFIGSFTNKLISLNPHLLDGSIDISHTCDTYGRAFDTFVNSNEQLRFTFNTSRIFVNTGHNNTDMIHTLTGAEVVVMDIVCNQSVTTCNDLRRIAGARCGTVSAYTSQKKRDAVDPLHCYECVVII